MLSRFSVRKPLTVFVCVVLVLLLGVVSLRGMTTDLLPSMDLPYVVVFTTYPGASPEKVEKSVTKPLEEQLLTASGLKELNSISVENVSYVIMEFVSGTNMDSVMLELSGYIDLAEGSFDDEAGTPTMMKINPDMMPVMISSVDMDGKSRAEISELLKGIMPELERIDGVASISSIGTLQEQFNIVLSQKKIDTLNKKILGEVDSELADAEDEIDKAKNELSGGKSTLDSQSKDQNAKLSDAASQLNDGKTKIQVALTAIETSLPELEKGLKTLKEQKAKLEKAQTGVNAMPTMQATIQQIESQLPTLEASRNKLADSISSLQKQKDDALAAGDQTTADALSAQISGLQTQLTELDSQISTLKKQLSDLKTQYAQLQEVVNSLSGTDISSALSELDESIRSAEDSLQDMKKQKASLEAALDKLNENEKLLNAGKITLNDALADARIQLAIGDAALQSAEKELDGAKDAAYKKAGLDGIVTQQMIAGVLAAQNFSMPAGYLEGDEGQQPVKVGELFSDEEQLRELPLMDTGIDGVGIVRLKDVADFDYADNADESYAKINGNDGIVLMFSKQSSASTNDVSKRINKTMDSLSKEYPGLHFTALEDQGVYISIVTNSVIQNLLFGGLLAILILIIFLGDIRPTLIIAMSIPLSVMFAIVLMYFSGVTLNVISLGGLALAVGMLVDNSIVVIENIYRLRSMGVSVHKAAVEGARQITGALFASTLTTVCVFAPILFTQGLARQLFTDMGLTIAYSLLASLIVALTLVPAASSGMLRRVNERKHPLFDRFIAWYEKVLKFALRHKAIVLVLTVLLLAFSAGMVPFMGMSIIPQAEMNEMSMTMSMPRGTTDSELYEMSGQVMERVLKIDDIETVGAIAGGSMMMGMGSSDDNPSISMYLLLKEKGRARSNTEIKTAILGNTRDLENMELEITTSSMDMSMLTGSGIDVVAKGEDLDTLAQIGQDIAAMLSETEGTVNVTNGSDSAKVETRIDVDKDKAIEYNLTTAQIFQHVATALQDNTKATNITIQGKEYPVIVVESEEDLMDTEKLERYTFKATVGEEEKTVQLSEVASFSEGQSPATIQRDGQTRVLTAHADIADGYNISLVSRDFEAKMNDYTPPVGYTVEVEGENQLINDTMRDTVFMILFAVALIYMIMVAQFQSLLSPFIIMFTIPLAFTGGLLALLITGMELSLIAMLGFLMLSGIIVNNGIVLIDYVNQLRIAGMERGEALVEAGKVRMRPILMTALTTILGLSTMALGVGMGAEMLQPLAVVTIGGMVYATILTLIVVPVLYDLICRKPIKVRLQTDDDILIEKRGEDVTEL